MNTFRVGLIGLGQVASGYGSPEEAAPYCHVGGLIHSEKARLVAVADPFEQAHTAFRAKWGDALAANNDTVVSYTDAAQMVREAKLDVLGLCVRGPIHYDALRPLFELSELPRAIFLEKPPFSSLQQADEIVALARERGITITVSYSRHWAPHVLKLEELVRAGLIGQVKSVVAYCGGPILSFASHTTDLVCQFACAQQDHYSPLRVWASGAVGSDRPAVPESYLARSYEIEPSLHSLFVDFDNGVSGLQVGSSGEHGLFYADVFGEKGRVRAGIYIPPAAFDADNNPIDLTPYEFPRDASVFQRAYDQIADFLAGGALPDCSERNWQSVNEIGFGAIESWHSGQIVSLPNLNRQRLVFAND